MRELVFYGFCDRTDEMSHRRTKTLTRDCRNSLKLLEILVLEGFGVSIFPSKQPKAALSHPTINQVTQVKNAILTLLLALFI
ncbi:hypothetical protein NDI33_20370 [Trichocoleus sp. DQ-A1]